MTGPLLHAFAKPSKTDFISIVRGKGSLLWDANGRQYIDAIGSLWYCQVGHGRTEIAEAVAAPHGAQLLYPGTCRELTASERAAKREVRPGAVRLRADGATATFEDFLWGSQSGAVDDVVLQRNDGVPAYNIAVVVDDAAQSITEVVRGDDLLPITATQVYLQQMLGIATPRYGHVPLVVGPDSERLAKRHGTVTLADLENVGVSAGEVRETLWASVGQSGDVLDWNAVPREPWVTPWNNR